jgi:hypothetical protein
MMTFKKSFTYFSFLVLFVTSSLYAGSRDKTTEFYITPQYSSSKTLTFDGDTSVDIDDSFGILFGFGYNFTPNWNLGVMFGYAEADYDAYYKDDHGNPTTDNFTLYTSSINVVGTYNFMRGAFTPFVSAHLGYTYTNTGIDNGEDYFYCDPWGWGPCYIYDGAHTKNSFNYGGFVGVRYDFKNSFFMKGAVGTNVIDYNSNNNSNFTMYQITFGSTF